MAEVRCVLRSLLQSVGVQTVLTTTASIALQINAEEFVERLAT